MVEGSLPTPEDRSSNPVIGKKIYCMFAVNCIEKTKIKQKDQDWAIKKLIKNYFSFLFGLPTALNQDLNS